MLACIAIKVGSPIKKGRSPSLTSKALSKTISLLSLRCTERGTFAPNNAWCRSVCRPKRWVGWRGLQSAMDSIFRLVNVLSKVFSGQWKGMHQRRSQHYALTGQFCRWCRKKMVRQSVKRTRWLEACLRNRSCIYENIPGSSAHSNACLSSSRYEIQKASRFVVFGSTEG